MSYKIPINRATSPNDSDSHSDSDSASEVGSENDWASSLGEATHTKSLFDDFVSPTPEECIKHDIESHNFDLNDICQRLNLDSYGRIRLINLIRNAGLTPAQIGEIKPTDPLLKDDNLLVPVIPDDPLLQYDPNDSWSDDEEPSAPVQAHAGPSSSNPKNADDKRIATLEAELEKARADLQSMRSLLSRTIGTEDDEDSTTATTTAGQGKGKGKGVKRDDDTHYFSSYEENEIHEIMLKDTVRTVSYGRFLLSNPQVFKGAVVLDVGCGTGILSMFAAQAGAKHVYAIEASGLAVKARENIKNNGFSDTITVIQGKVEDISLPVREVDVIVSEWMGYMLLYESMLDSVLVARDRFLAPTGLMAPSQTRLVLSAITAEKTWKEEVLFWRSAYGFDLSAMEDPVFGDGLVEPVNAEEVVTSEAIVRDINTHSATIQSLDFHSSFTLGSTSTKTETVRAFLTHFDTFFSPLSGDKSNASPENNVEILTFGNDEFERPIETSSSEGGLEVSFTTGPRGKVTHWKQVIFLLREPITLKENQEIRGKFYCKKSTTNSRELDVEIHFVVAQKGAELGEKAEYTVQTFRVK